MLYHNTGKAGCIHCLCFPLDVFFSIFRYQITVRAYAMPERARHPVCINERESSSLFSPSLICSACVETDTLAADSADECVCAARSRDIHNCKAVFQQQGFNPAFLPHIVFSHIPDGATCKLHVCTHSGFTTDIAGARHPCLKSRFTTNRKTQSSHS